jgi:hypothetical protein
MSLSCVLSYAWKIESEPWAPNDREIVRGKLAGDYCSEGQVFEVSPAFLVLIDHKKRRRQTSKINRAARWPPGFQLKIVDRKR